MYGLCYKWVQVRKGAHWLQMVKPGLTAGLTFRMMRTMNNFPYILTISSEKGGGATRLNGTSPWFCQALRAGS